MVEVTVQSDWYYEYVRDIMINPMFMNNTEIKKQKEAQR
jgi:hypothetical protein